MGGEKHTDKLIMLDFSGRNNLSLDGDVTRFLAEHKNEIYMTDVKDDKCYIQFGSKLYCGLIEKSIGTDMLFEAKQSPNDEDVPMEWTTSTELVMTMREATLTRRLGLWGGDETGEIPPSLKVSSKAREADEKATLMATDGEDDAGTTEAATTGGETAEEDDEEPQALRILNMESN